MPLKHADIFSLLSNKERRRFFFFVMARSLIAFLDLAGLLILSIFLSASIDSNNQTDNTLALLPGISSLRQSSVFLLITACGFFLAKSGLAFAFLKAFSTFAAKVEVRHSRQIFDQISKSSLEEVGHFPISDIVYGITHSVTMSSSHWLFSVSSVITESFMLLCLIIFLVYQNVILTIACIGYILIVGSWASIYIKKQNNTASMNFDVGYKESTHLVNEFISNFKSITHSQQKDSYSSVYEGSRAKFANANSQFSFLGAIPRYLIELIILAGALLLVGGKQWGPLAEIPLSLIGLFVVSLFRMMGSALPLMNSLLSLQRILNEASMHIAIRNRLNPIPNSMESEAGSSQNLCIGSHEISIKDLSFYYSTNPAHKLEVADISIPFGSFIVLAGPSGSGKSTFINLIMGLLLPNRGSIEYGHNNSCLIPLHYRNHFGYVPQDPHLINGTFLENITLELRRVDFSEAQMWEAIRRSSLENVHSKLPQGIHTMLSGSSSRLSGGEIQRVALARVLYRSPSVILMDEPSSSLDDETEQAIFDTLLSLKGKSTLIVSSHNRVLYDYADRVIFFNGDGYVS